MNDFTPKPSSSLVVAEKKAHRPGGCVGIFFKLFDWNRRFGKQQLLPKKLIAPARANQVSKKFNADEKLPMRKHLLIADGNGGDFPCMKKNVKRGAGNPEQRHEMRSPGLVARLMGLESMPPVESKSPDNSRNGRFVGGSESNKESPSLEKGSPRHELQPQKIQKTGLSERQPVSRFGVDALQIRNALSRSRKRHPKLASPVKSPRIARSTSRLRDAAARILEPGLQATSRAKCTLTYPDSMVQSMKNEVNRGEEMIIELPTQSSFEVGSQGLKAQTSCQNCGHVIEPMDLTSDSIEETPLDMPTINLNDAFFQRVGESKPRAGMHCEKESEVVLLRSRYQPEARAQAKVSSGVHQRKTTLNAMPYGQNQWAFPDNSSFQRNVSSPMALKHRAQGLSTSHSPTLTRGDRVPPRPRRVSSSNALSAPKDFISLNRNVSQSRVRFTRKPNNFAEVRRQHCIPKDDALSTQRNFVRRRSAAVGRQIESINFSRSTMERQRSSKSKVMTGNRATYNAKSVNSTCLKSRSVVEGVEGDNGVSGSKDINVVSFSFSSPMKSKCSSFFPTQRDKKGMGQIDLSNNDDIAEQMVLEDSKYGEESSLTSTQMKGDAIGALLEQKLKELTRQAEEESLTGIMPQGRTTASILQELISALTEERPISPDINDSLSCSASMRSRISQGKKKIKRLPMRFSGDHFSPGSVLDASFSNDSCVSSSRDDCSGHMFQSDNMDLSYDEPQIGHSDADLVDSASSMITNDTGNYTIVPVTHLLEHISNLLDRANLHNMKLSTFAHCDYTKEVLLNAELLFRNVGHSEGFVDFLVGPFLDELVTLAAAAWRSTVILGFEVSKGDNQNPLRRFLFDCLVECLHLRYNRHCNSGFMAWRKLQRQMSSEALIQVFDYEVRKWASLAHMTPDELIDWEMSTSLGKWTDFDTEAFESAAETGQVIFENLLDEIVADFL